MCVRSLNIVRDNLDFGRILRLAHEQLSRRPLGLVDFALRRQPIGALDNIKASDSNQHRRNDRRGVHPSPGLDCW